MEAFKIRLFEEFDLLAEKINKLEEFMTTDEFKCLKLKLRWLTRLQHSHMIHYLNCLQKRMNILLTVDDYEDYALYLENKEKATKEEHKDVKKKSKRKTTKKEKKDDKA